jgi:hypothetical protein
MVVLPVFSFGKFARALASASDFFVLEFKDPRSGTSVRRISQNELWDF